MKPSPLKRLPDGDQRPVYWTAVVGFIVISFALGPSNLGFFLVFAGFCVCAAWSGAIRRAAVAEAELRQEKEKTGGQD